ncbi:hypothetical protein HYC85_004703 [Camellia sinensis]|uniref:BHLH domain-containing protein n=1 Tax=Camellia sinensis TaxID=4442 RepID=A0A7J7HZZ4_CAMSI|nr:hypothetical protein HYC85_004703 [Camellia sinensis]
MPIVLSVVSDFCIISPLVISIRIENWGKTPTKEKAFEECFGTICHHFLPILGSPRGQRSFPALEVRVSNGRMSQLGLNNGELPYRLSPLMASVKLSRVLSSPSIKAAVSPVGAQENKNSTQTQMEMRSSIGSDTKFRKVLEFATSDRTEFASSNEGSSVSEKIPNGETVLKNPISSNSRKRKEGLRGKSNSVNATMVTEAEDDPNTKRFKPNEGSGSKNDSVKIGDEDEKQTKANQKPPDPPKDYIHVRARRGQATDSHSLAERVFGQVQREKISERMKLLQDLVPGCNKMCVNGKALMLDEIINYFLSMKLASVNPRLEFNMDSLLSKDVNDDVSRQDWLTHTSNRPWLTHTSNRPWRLGASKDETSDMRQCHANSCASRRYWKLGPVLDPNLGAHVA